MKKTLILTLGFALICGIVLVDQSCLTGADKDNKGLWKDPNDSSLPIDFGIQGEYVGKTKNGQALGAQVIALGQDQFQTVLYPGGLPGAGWDGKNKMLMDGKLAGAKAVFKPAEGKKSYLAKSPAQFSATAKFPPVGQKPCIAEISKGTMIGNIDNTAAFELKKIVRKSKTLGMKPPKGAIVLFDGTSKDHWTGGRVDAETKLLNTDGKDILTKKKFNDYVMHVEFMIPFKPGARGQGRGNSGFYQVDHYEVQILDSFGLEGKDNECGGVYKKKSCDVNACFPPLTWQTYDVEFKNARVGNVKTIPATMTVKLNGIVIHDNVQIKGKTGGSRRGAIGTPGPIKLQGHGNPLQFRNVWILEK